MICVTLCHVAAVNRARWRRRLVAGLLPDPPACALHRVPRRCCWSAYRTSKTCSSRLLSAPIAASGAAAAVPPDTAATWSYIAAACRGCVQDIERTCLCVDCRALHASDERHVAPPRAPAATRGDARPLQEQRGAVCGRLRRARHAAHDARGGGTGGAAGAPDRQVYVGDGSDTRAAI